MKSVIPRQFLFRFCIPCKRVDKIHQAGRALLDLSADHAIPFFGAMDNERSFAELRLAWNESGIGIQWQTQGKKQRPYGEPDRPNACDGLCLWIDSRDTRNIHRASRYCHRFYLLATTSADKLEPTALHKPIHRALEDSPQANMSDVRMSILGIDAEGEAFIPGGRKEITDYRMEAFLPANTIHGFDPEVNTRLGFFYQLRDREMGNQLLAAGNELPYWEDPSLWQVLELQ